MTERRTVRAPRLRRGAVVMSFAGLLLATGSPARGWTAPNDPQWPKQWGPVQMGAPDAWTKSTGKGVIVAVVDSGVDVDHPDLKPKLVAGRDFGDNDANPDDDSEVKDENGPLRGHGTHVAGIIAAATNNSTGVAGTAPEASIMPLKIAERNAFGDWARTVPEAINYAVDNGAKVINLSIISRQQVLILQSDALEAPCNSAYQRGALCVVATGNSGQGNPSGYRRTINALMVTANDRDGKHANFGQKADTKWSLSAPGVGIMSTVPVEDGSYAIKQGTSMAAPHAAGVAALLFAQGLSADQVVARMLDTAVAIGDPATNGAGIVNATAAVGATPTEPPAQQASPSGGSVLLPKAATRTTVAPRGSSAPPASAPGDGPVAPTETTLPPEENAADFASDLVGDSPETAQPVAANRADDAGDIAFYSLATIGGLAVLGTGLSTLSQYRRRRSS